MNLIQATKTIGKLASFNMKIIFGGKFLWFMLTGFLLFCYLMFQTAWNGNIPSESTIYGQLFLPALLLIFYPAVFGIQNDADHRILEILFCIPNYKFKVWFFRLMMIYVEIYFILVLYAGTAYILLYPANPFEIAMQLMFPVLFMGNLAFFYSTLLRNGNATAVLIIVTTIILLFLAEAFFNNSMWNIFLNPFEVPKNIHPAIWAETLFNNRLFLIVSSVIFILLGLFNLQKREKFL